MPLPVNLKDAADQMGAVPDNWIAYVNRKTGDIVMLPEDEFATDIGPEFDEMHAEAEAVEASEDFVALPDRFEIDDYAMMERFCYNVEDESLGEELIREITGRGAFRRFKDRIHREGIEQDWYAFRAAALKEIAADFLEAEGIPFIDPDASG
jgi:hypothetical protein